MLILHVQNRIVQTGSVNKLIQVLLIHVGNIKALELQYFLMFIVVFVLMIAVRYEELLMSESIS